MPSASNAKSEKPASSEAADNSPIRQIIIIIEHKIRNLEKRKSKLTSYRDLQKSGKELNADQKVAVAKYDEVAQTLDFARDMFKQVTSIAATADREAKKQAKKDAWVRNATETSKIREVLLVLDCLMQMGNAEARDDFLNGTNGAEKLTEDDLKTLDDLYPEVTPKHELNEEGVPAFQIQITKAADHLYRIIDGKPQEVLGTTYAHIKEIVSSIHDCGYFDKQIEPNEQVDEEAPQLVEDQREIVEEPVDREPVQVYVPAPPLPVPPAPAVVPAPAYPLRTLAPMTLQEVEHAYFSQQYSQQRPITEVIGSQNFYFLQESEIDSPVGTPQPPPILNQPSPPGPIPTQTFTNQHYVHMPGRIPPEPAALPIPQPHFAPPPDHPPYPAVTLSAPAGPIPPQAVSGPILPPAEVQISVAPTPVAYPMPSEQAPPPTDEVATAKVIDTKDDDWQESQSPDRDEANERSKTQGQGDGQNRFRRYGRGGRGQSNGYRGRGGYQNRQNNDGYQNRQNNDGYHNRQNNDGYHSRHNDFRHNKETYQNRHGNDNYTSRGNDSYYGNGDSGNGHQQNDNSNRDRYDNNQGGYQGGFKNRGRGAPRGGTRGSPRVPRNQHYTRKQTQNAE